MSNILLMLMGGLSAVTIYGALRPLRLAYLLAKPLTMLCIIGLAFTQHSAAAAPQCLYWALALSLLGDICLMFPARAFGAGLLAFLLAHVAYILLFWRLGAQINLWICLTLVLVAILYLVQLARFKPRLMPAIMLYTLALVLMVASGLTLAYAQQNVGLAIGVLLFALSDGVLAWNKFGKPFWHAQAWILSSYFAAQSLIVLAL